MLTVKQEVATMLGKLPENCSLEDVQYHLYVMEKVRLGLESAEKEGALTQAEAEERLSVWLTE